MVNEECNLFFRWVGDGIVVRTSMFLQGICFGSDDCSASIFLILIQSTWWELVSTGILGGGMIWPYEFWPGVVALLSSSIPCQRSWALVWFIVCVASSLHSAVRVGWWLYMLKDYLHGSSSGGDAVGHACNDFELTMTTIRAGT